jgi:hypothetical protein
MVPLMVYRMTHAMVPTTCERKERRMGDRRASTRDCWTRFPLAHSMVRMMVRQTEFLILAGHPYELSSMSYSCLA